MPQLPDTLGALNVPQSQQQVASYDPTILSRAKQRGSEMVANATGNLARGIAGGVEAIQDAQEKNDYANAQAAFLRDKVNQDNGYDNDNDWATMGQRYSSAMKKSLDTASQMIRNPLARKQFVAYGEAHIQDGLAGINRLSRDKEVDYGRSKLTESVNSNLEAAFMSSSTETRASLINATAAQIDAAVAKRYISAEGGAKMKIEVADKYKAFRQNQLGTELGGQLDQIKLATYESPDVTARAAEIDQAAAQYRGSLPADAIDKMVKDAKRDMMQLAIKSPNMPIDRGYELVTGKTPANSTPSLPQATPQLMNVIVSYGEKGKTGDRSPAGALGKYQVMPETGREIAGELGIPFDPVKLQYDDAYGQTIATAYMNKNLSKYGGNVVLASAAYNAGPGAVDDWIRRFGDPNKGEISNADWAARIPFDETRGYVARVSRQIGGTQDAAPEQSPAVAAGIDPMDIPESVAILNSRADKEDAAAEVQRTARRQQVADKWKDHIASIQQTGKGLDGFNLDDYQSAFTPHDFDALKAEERQAQAFNGTIQPIMTGTAEEAAKTLSSVEPVPGSPNFEYQTRLQAAAQAAMNERIKELKEDPAGYVISHDPNAADAQSEIDNVDPEDQDAVTTARVALDTIRQSQRRMGVPDEDIRPLPATTANRIGGDLMNQEPAKVTAKLDSINAIYGPDGLKQVLAVKGVSPGMRMVAFADQPADAVLRQRIVQAEQMSNDELNSAIKARNVKADDIDNALNGIVDPNLLSTPGFGAYLDSMKKTMKLMVAGGASVGDAAAAVYAPWRRAYNFADTYFVPTKYDMNKVTAGLNGALKHLSSFDIDTLGGAAAYLPKDFTHEQMNQALERQGRWVTAPDDSGAILTLDRGDHLPGPPVMLKNGQRLIVKFSDAERWLYGTGTPKMGGRIGLPNQYRTPQPATPTAPKPAPVREPEQPFSPSGGPSLPDGN